MKLIALIVLYVTLVSATAISTNEETPKESRFIANAVVHQLFEMARKVIRTGSISKSIPVMDPWEINFRETHIAGQLLRIDSNMTDALFLGLGDFKVTKADFSKSDVSIDLDMTFPELRLTAEYYEMDGAIFEAIPLLGEGTLDMLITDLRFVGTVYLKQSEDGKSILIDRMEHSQFSIENVSSMTEFDGNFDDIFNTMIGELLAGYMNRFNGYILNFLSEPFIESLNVYLDWFETWRIIAVIH